MLIRWCYFILSTCLFRGTILRYKTVVPRVCVNPWTLFGIIIIFRYWSLVWYIKIAQQGENMTADGLFETTSIPGHLAPTPERLERLLSKQTLEELYEVEEQPFARWVLSLWFMPLMYNFHLFWFFFFRWSDAKRAKREKKIWSRALKGTWLNRGIEFGHSFWQKACKPVYSSIRGLGHQADSLKKESASAEDIEVETFAPVYMACTFVAPLRPRLWFSTVHFLSTKKGWKKSPSSTRGFLRDALLLLGQDGSSPTARSVLLLLLAWTSCSPSLCISKHQTRAYGILVLISIPGDCKEFDKRYCLGQGHCFMRWAAKSSSLNVISTWIRFGNHWNQWFPVVKSFKSQWNQRDHYTERKKW